VEVTLDDLENWFTNTFTMQLSEPSFKELPLARGSHPGFKKRWIQRDIRDRIIDVICDRMKHIFLVRADDKLADCGVEHSKVTFVNSDEFFFLLSTVTGLGRT